MENILKEEVSNESKNYASIQWKKKFKTLDVVPNNYNNASLQGEHSFEYTYSKKKAKMEWKTNKVEQIHKRGAKKVYKNKFGPRRTAKSLKNCRHRSNHFSRIK